MQEWQEIVKAALVGTSRTAPPSLGSEDAVGTLLGKLDATDRERLLLCSAGVLACCRRAGYRHENDAGSTPMPAADDERPRIGPSAARDLDTMLTGEHQEALPDWLAAVMAQGRRVPEELLPDLLELGRRKADLQAAITGVIGKRGRWLAAQRPDWKYATQQSLFATVEADVAATHEPEEAARQWRIGTREARLALLEVIRVTDPALARELVVSTWAQDSANDRALFLKTFAHGLSLDDEPLLERALDDRRKEIREQAAALLIRLPGSQLCRRMIERVGPMVQIAPSYGREDTIKITIPDRDDPALQRDGVPPRPQPGSGEQTWWARHLLAAVPLSHWCRQFDMTPAEIVAANRSSQWQQTVLYGWTCALTHVPDREWAKALLDSWTDHKHVSPPNNIAPWSDLLPQSCLEACASRLVRDNKFPMTLNHPAAGLLRQCRNTWGIDLSHAVLSKMQETIEGREDQSDYLIHALEVFIPLMAPEVRAESRQMLERLAAKHRYLKQRLENYDALAQFRFEMMKRIEEGV